MHSMVEGAQPSQAWLRVRWRGRSLRRFGCVHGGGGAAAKMQNVRALQLDDD